MSQVTAKQVQELRQATGAGMMDAKKALTAADGDFDAAVQALREKGLAKAAGRTDRENAEGLIAIAQNDSAAALVQLKCETDFAAKSESFIAFAQSLADDVLANGVDALNARKAELEDLQITIKENIEIGTTEVVEGEFSAYLHGGGRIGVLLQGEDVPAETLHEIALHSAFAKPRYLTRDEVPAEDIEKERAAFLDITKAEGKPEQAWDKIVEGRVNSWLAESVLLEQGVFGEKETVTQKIGSGKITKLVMASIG